MLPLEDRFFSLFSVHFFLPPLSLLLYHSFTCIETIMDNFFHNGMGFSGGMNTSNNSSSHHPSYLLSPTNQQHQHADEEEMYEPSPIVSRGDRIRVVPTIRQLPYSLRENCDDYLDALGGLNNESSSRRKQNRVPRKKNRGGPLDEFDLMDFEPLNMDESVNASTTSSLSAGSQRSLSFLRNSMPLPRAPGSSGSSNKSTKKSVSMIMNSFGQTT